jgi:hypothetical protein
MPDRRDLKEVLEDLRGAGLDELADELEEREEHFKGTTLRKQNAELTQLLEEANKKAERLERVPARDKAFREYGIDFENLRPAEARAIEQYDGELEPEKIAEFVEEFDLPLVANGSQQQSETPPPAAGVVQAARQAPGRQQVAAMQITPDDVRGWSATQVLEWQREHPSEWQALLQGKTVTGLPAPVGQGSPRETADVKRGHEGVRT